MNLNDMSLEELNQIDNGAPDNTQYYLSASKTYYKFHDHKGWLYSPHGWITRPELYNLMKGANSLIRLSVIRSRITELEKMDKPSDATPEQWRVFQKQFDEFTPMQNRNEPKAMTDKAVISSAKAKSAWDQITKNKKQVDQTNCPHFELGYHDDEGRHDCLQCGARVQISGTTRRVVGMPADKVNNPSHYTQGGIECIDAMEAMLTPEQFIGYLRGNIFKYQWRYKDKNGAEDLKKARWYSDKLLEREELDSKHRP